MYVKVQMVKIDSFLTAYDLMVPVMWDELILPFYSKWGLVKVSFA